MELSSCQFKALEHVAEKSGLDLILLFGSAARGITHAKSDLDIAVRYRRFSTEERIDQLMGDLQSVFPGAQVDLGILNTADPLFLKKIMEDARLLYGDPRRLAELEILAFKRYLDHRPYLRMEEDYVRRRLAQTSP
ncbi:MAG: nucleotidyltransferase domain-containing protein [Armatimonadetes bacterium]|nr:nucleotidyltransferase domain-containing protein [Armatimonadota bacterium]